MTARAVVAQLLEADPDDFDPKSDVQRYTEAQIFDEGVTDILAEARQLYLRLVKAGVILEYREEDDPHGEPHASVAGTPGFDGSAVSQAILRLAIERRGALGAKKAYEMIKRHGQFVI